MNAQYLGHVSLADGKNYNVTKDWWSGRGGGGCHVSIGGERSQLEPGVRRYGMGWGGGCCAMGGDRSGDFSVSFLVLIYY